MARDLTTSIRMRTPPVIDPCHFSTRIFERHQPPHPPCGRQQRPRKLPGGKHRAGGEHLAHDRQLDAEH